MCTVSLGFWLFFRDTEISENTTEKKLCELKGSGFGELINNDQNHCIAIIFWQMQNMRPWALRCRKSQELTSRESSGHLICGTGRPRQFVHIQCLAITFCLGAQGLCECWDTLWQVLCVPGWSAILGGIGGCKFTPGAMMMERESETCSLVYSQSPTWDHLSSRKMVRWYQGWWCSWWESALIFFDPEIYDTVKLNLVKYSAHLACWGLRLFAQVPGFYDLSTQWMDASLPPSNASTSPWPV